MPICTPDQVKAAARIDGSEFDATIPGYISAAQSMIEHECGVAVGAFSTPPDAGVTQCAIAISAALVANPTAGRDEMHDLLRSSLLDRARLWV